MTETAVDQADARTTTAANLKATESKFQVPAVTVSENFQDLVHVYLVSESGLRISAITADLTEELRHSVLWPNKPLEFVRLDEDKYGYHFGAFVPCRDKPVGVISVFFEPVPDVTGTGCRDGGCSGTTARFRKFACDPKFQGQGIGTSLLRYTASYFASIGATVLWCDARTSSCHWYQKRGFITFGDSFFKSSVEYIRMKMELAGGVAEEPRSPPGMVA